MKEQIASVKAIKSVGTKNQFNNYFGAITLFLMLIVGLTANGQKFAFVDTDYLLKRIPAYESAQEQLNEASKNWQQEIEAEYKDAAALYKSFQTESVFLSAEMKVKKEEEIIAKEKNAKLLQQKYFGTDGELFKKREALIKPIQDEIFTAIQTLCSEKGYEAIFDKSSKAGVIFADPKLDISDEVLKQLGIVQ